MPGGSRTWSWPRWESTRVPECGRRLAELDLAYAEFCDPPRRSGDLSAISAVAVAVRWTVDRLIAGGGGQMPPARAGDSVGGSCAHLAGLALPAGCYLRRWWH